ncbi:MAG TPA: rhodanese-like domain-containing protein [Saprospiraceae bacterium]|nr:rhodanese-like domain-containing protein [Saprospiraceae bacterium]
MKNFTFSPRQLISLGLIILGVIIAAVPKNTTIPFKLTAEQILEELKSGTQYVAPDVVAQMIVEKDPTLQLIDVRPQAEFEKYHIPGAVNVPLDNILSEEFTDLLDQDVMTNVLYANGSTRANEAWMLLRQMGFENNYVLSGGLNYWFEAILNPQAPPSTSADDELAKYDFRKGASQALGGGGMVLSTSTSKAGKSGAPKPKAGGKKKAVKGGCS